MKKITLTLLFLGLFFGFSGSVFAQENYGEALNAFVKFGSNSRIGANYEIQISKNFTVAPQVVIPFDFGYFVLGARADYYFDSLFKLPTAWDIYAGVDTGIIVNGGDSFDLNLHVGAEYKFTENWGILGEIGGGTSSTGGIGVAYHF
ncbi:MAG: hypothetical protein DSY82_05260 [Flavobacteriia bacterium]|nr:MAG: hypothetical protein DSY82_05260 [Flavobacteriia bacterium]